MSYLKPALFQNCQAVLNNYAYIVTASPYRPHACYAYTAGASS